MIVGSCIQAKKKKNISCHLSLIVCVLTGGRIGGERGKHVKISQNIAIELVALMFEAAGDSNSYRIGFANLLLECLNCLF